MLARRVIPCLDVRAGRVVKGVQFVGLRDAGDPVELGRRYALMGADELVFLDITASAEQRGLMVDMAARVAEQVFIPFTVGGGIRTVDDFRAILSVGADKVAINTAAVEDPSLIGRAAGRFGSQCVVVAVDARARASGGWEVLVHGGRTPTGLDAVEWAATASASGAGEILLTSMDRDGTLAGFDLELTRAVADAVAIPVIASGGGGTPADCVAAVTEGGADAALVASIVHDGTYSVSDIKQALSAAGVPVRIVAPE